MEIERIEEWIGQEVVDVEGEKVGKLEEVYFRGEDPLVGEVKTGAMARKRLLVPLLGASFSRVQIRLDVALDSLAKEETSGSGPSAEDLSALGEGYSVSPDELESSNGRAERAEADREAQRRRAEADAEAKRRAAEADEAEKHAREAREAAAEAEATRRATHEEA